MSQSTRAPRQNLGLLDRIERIGNALPDPMTLFVIGTVVVFLASWLVSASGHVSQLMVDGESTPRATAQAWNLMSRDGFRWLITDLIKTFTGFAPLGLVLVAAIGIAIAEKSGLIAAGLKLILFVVPPRLLTPAAFFAGVMSSMAVDAGYVVLPPLAAAIFRAVGRSPLVGLAAVFAGVACGFNANLFITGLDPMIAGLTQTGAQLLDKTYSVSPVSNWYFMIASTFVITGVGWFVSSTIVEPRLASKSPEDGGPGAVGGEPAMQLALTDVERRSLVVAAIAGVLTLGALILVQQASWGFLYDDPESIGPGKAQAFPTWVGNIVPLLLILFIVPGMAYGIAAKTIRSDRDVVRMMSEYMSMLGNYIVLAFFTAVFVAAFGKSELGKMVAIEGGNVLRELGLPAWAMMAVFVLFIAGINLFVGSMSAKWSMLAPVFVPMFMTTGISPELTQAAYRIGDSCTNCITPLNSYLIIVLVYLQQYAKKAGMGTLIALMLPYSITILIAWTLMLLVWIGLGLPLGPDGALEYVLPEAAPK